MTCSLAFRRPPFLAAGLSVSRLCTVDGPRRFCFVNIRRVMRLSNKLAADLAINAASFRGQSRGGQGHPATEVARAVYRKWKRCRSKSTPLLRLHGGIGMLSCGRHIPARLHCTVPDPRVNNAATRSRRGRGTWISSRVSDPTPRHRKVRSPTKVAAGNPPAKW